MATSRVVGLDIGTTFIRAAELEFGRGPRTTRQTPTLVRYGQVPLPLGAVRGGEVAESAIVSAALRDLWARTKFSTRDVVIGVGNQRVLVRELELPWMPAAQIRGSLAFQVQELLPMSVDEALLDYYPTGESQGPAGRMITGMLVAAQRDTVTANVLAVEGAGLRPTMVDLNAFALLRAMARGPLAEQVVAFVDIGARVSNVVVAAHGVPRFIRTLPSGGQDATDAVASAMQISAMDAERVKRETGVGLQVAPERQAAADAVATPTRALVEAIRNTFVYYQGNHPGAGIEVVVLTGGGCHLAGLGQYLASASRLPVTLGDPLAGVKMTKSLDRSQLAGAESLAAMPVGLAYGVAA
ncbi:type IV pilus assembly protein PilM [Actinotalea sp. AC32]|nr:type IV pilus assembly protein PilM [Actinotalea sp. AC32]